MKEKIKRLVNNLTLYPLQLVFSPFKKFEDIKDGKQGGFLATTILIIIYGLIQILSAQYKIFFLNSYNPKTINGPLIFLGTIVPILLLILANYLTTTLFDGSGKFKEIYQVAGFSLHILIIFQTLSIIISNFITQSDLVLFKVFNVLGFILFAIILFIGLIVIHEFSAMKNLVMIVATLFTFLVLLYLIFLAFSLLQQMLGFTSQFIEEILFRIRNK